MTLRDRAFQIYLLSIILLGAGLWLILFLTLYHPILELKSTLLVLSTDSGSLSLQWPHGQVSIWFTAPYQEWRIWPP